MKEIETIVRIIIFFTTIIGLCAISIGFNIFFEYSMLHSFLLTWKNFPIYLFIGLIAGGSVRLYGKYSEYKKITVNIILFMVTFCLFFGWVVSYGEDRGQIEESDIPVELDRNILVETIQYVYTHSHNMYIDSNELEIYLLRDNKVPSESIWKIRLQENEAPVISVEKSTFLNDEESKDTALLEGTISLARLFQNHQISLVEPIWKFLINDITADTFFIEKPIRRYMFYIGVALLIASGALLGGVLFRSWGMIMVFSIWYAIAQYVLLFSVVYQWLITITGVTILGIVVFLIQRAIALRIADKTEAKVQEDI